jgi:hypothetical protein
MAGMKRVYCGWIEKSYAKKPFYWRRFGEPELVINGEGIFMFKSKSDNPAEEVKIKITVEVI